jgi:hypothetical protein
MNTRAGPGRRADQSRGRCGDRQVECRGSESLARWAATSAIRTGGSDRVVDR